MGEAEDLLEGMATPNWDWRTTSASPSQQRALQGRSRDHEDGAAAASDIISERQRQRKRAHGRGVTEAEVRSEGELMASEDGEVDPRNDPLQEADEGLHGSGSGFKKSYVY